jgi:hypothetical protein
MKALGIFQGVSDEVTWLKTFLVEIVHRIIELLMHSSCELYCIGLIILLKVSLRSSSQNSCNSASSSLFAVQIFLFLRS